MRWVGLRFTEWNGLIPHCCDLKPLGFGVVYFQAPMRKWTTHFRLDGKVKRKLMKKDQQYMDNIRIESKTNQYSIPTWGVVTNQDHPQHLGHSPEIAREQQTLVIRPLIIHNRYMHMKQGWKNGGCQWANKEMVDRTHSHPILQDAFEHVSAKPISLFAVFCTRQGDVNQPNHVSQRQKSRKIVRSTEHGQNQSNIKLMIPIWLFNIAMERSTHLIAR